MIERSSLSMSTKTKFKIIFLGDQSAGKTSIIERFIHEKFSERSNPTIGIDFLGKNITHKNKHYRLQLWDTAGQEKFRSLIPSYLKDAICVVYVFDTNNPESLKNMERWVQLFRENRGPLTVSVLCGNKIDLERNLDQSQFEKFTNTHKMPYFQVSAKTGEKVDQMFLSIIDLINKELNKNKQKDESKQSQDATELEFPPLTKQPLVNLNANQNNQQERKNCCL